MPTPSLDADSADFDAALTQFIQSVSADQPAGAPIDQHRFLDMWRHPEPQLLPIPEATRGFRIRVDLQHTKPPVWRRIEVPGDITLPRLHEVLQAAMGWTDTHLHRFRTGNDRNPPEFLTQFDLDEGSEGMLEDGVRLDQVVAAPKDLLWYDYDFGDGWQHTLRVEQVLDTPPEAPRCITGRLACPPEDCGGVWGYQELADWVRADFAEALRPEVFESEADARAWLPLDWHPDVFDLAETNELIARITAEPPPLGEELTALLEREHQSGSRELREILTFPVFFEAVRITPEEAARITEPFRVLLDVLGNGANLTAAGYLKPADVEQIAHRAGFTEWWIGKANREDQTWPVAKLRAVARALGLVAVRKGRIAPTQAARRCAGDPEALLRHIIGRLPLGKSTAERHAGWAALVVAGSEAPAALWDIGVSEIMAGLGWRSSVDYVAPPPSDSLTLDVLKLLAGARRRYWEQRDADPTVAAIARAALNP